MKSDTKGNTKVYCAKRLICTTMTNSALFNCIAKFNKFIVLGGYKINKQDNTYSGIVELLTDAGDQLGCVHYTMDHHHEDQIAVIRMFKSIAHVFVAALRFHLVLDIYAIFNDKLVLMTSVLTVDDNLDSRVWHRDMKVATKSVFHSEIIIVTDKKLLSIRLRV